MKPLMEEEVRMAGGSSRPLRSAAMQRVSAPLD
jgi:hypothetical protein